MTTDAELDEIFDGIRGHEPELSDTLMARILHDADELQPKPEVAAPVAAEPSAPSVLEWLGGWLGLGGLAAASLAGLTIGMVPGTVTDGLVGETLSLTVYDETLASLGE